MDSSLQVNVPLRLGGKKMRKRRELDALISHSLTKKGNSKRSNFTTSGNPQDKLLSGSTDDQEDYTWHKINHSKRLTQRRSYTFLGICAPILFVLSCSMLIGFMYWLYIDMRQQIYEYRQKIEEISATNEILPDTLQNWHETSAMLLKNQSALRLKINELHLLVENIRYNLSTSSALQPKISRSKQQKIVADFGAKLEALATDIDVIKERYNTFVKGQAKIRSDLRNLQEYSNEIKNISSERLCMSRNTDEIYSLKSSIKNELKSLNTNLIVVNDTFSQKATILSEELVKHKTKIDELYDRSENITSHVSSIKSNCQKYEEKIVNFEKYISYFNSHLMELHNVSKQFQHKLQNINVICHKATDEGTRQSNHIDSNQTSVSSDCKGVK